MVETLSAWLLAAMLTVSAPGRTLPAAAAETASEGAERYGAIAQAIASVVAAEEPLYPGRRGRERTALLVLAVSFMESGWRRDVDLGQLRGSGMDSCLLQIRVGQGTTREGWRHTDLVGDREKCVRAGLALMRRSFAACRRHGDPLALAAYASGSCARGHKQSRDRVSLARKWEARFPIELGTQ